MTGIKLLIYERQKQIPPPELLTDLSSLFKTVQAYLPEENLIKQMLPFSQTLQNIFTNSETESFKTLVKKIKICLFPCLFSN